MYHFNTKYIKNKRDLVLGLVAVVLIFLFYISLPRDLFLQTYSTTIYSADGQLMGARISKDEQWRFPLTDTIPDKFAQSIVRFEDNRFYKHWGVDPIAIARAFYLNISKQSVVSGGSTITMQLIRLMRENKPRTITEKFVEIYLATRVEFTYSKKEILRYYISHAPFGGNVIGIDAAAWRYFGRKASSLSWAESATLAVLPNAPGLIHPGKNRKELLLKRNRLLFRLCQDEVINQQEYELACMEPLPDAPTPLPSQAPHLLTQLMKQQTGCRFNTTLDNNLQSRVQAIVNDFAKDYESNYVYNLAVLVADVETGRVLAYVGNVTDGSIKDHGRYVDIISSRRSTGSVLKPFLYAAMLDDGGLLPNTLVPDVPLYINGFAPQNYNKTFYGAVPAKLAIERSLNVPLVRMLNDYGIGKFLGKLRQLGMTTLPYNEDHYGSTLILGGAEGSLWDMAGMYASMSRVLNHYQDFNGKYNPADIHPLTSLVGNDKKKIESITDKTLTNKSLLSAASIWYAYEAMSVINRPEEESDWQQFASMKKIAWKTGTSYGSRDAWAIGTTSKYVVGVWCGNASGEGRPDLTGIGYAAPVLFDVFSLLPASPWFATPYDEMQKEVVCSQSGYKAGPDCEPTDSVWIPVKGVKTSLCPYHKLVHLSTDERYQVNSSCESPDKMISKKWFVLPPSQEYYYRSYHLDYKQLPPFKPGCEENIASPMSLIYPQHGMSLYVPKGFGKDKEKIIFKAAHSRPDAKIYWHLDEQFIGGTSDNHQIAYTPRPGKHQLTLVDDAGNRKIITFQVVSK